MANRAVRFELHIRPLFRALDRDHMLFFADLWDTATFYTPDGQPRDDVIKKVRDHVITDAPTDVMPMLSHGGPWPQEWRQLFERWIAEGCKKLDLAKGTYSALRLPEGTVLLSADGVDVVEGSVVWFERLYRGPADFTYCLYSEPPSNIGAIKNPVSVVEEIKNVPDTLINITVVDRDGSRTVV